MLIAIVLGLCSFIAVIVAVEVARKSEARLDEARKEQIDRMAVDMAAHGHSV